MNNETLILALFYSRDEAYKQDSPLYAWEVWEIIEGEYPSLAGISRTTIYRCTNRLVQKGLLKHAGTQRGRRSQDRQIFTITEAGKRQLEKEISEVRVEVNDLRAPSMTLRVFMDFIVMATYVSDSLVESAVEKRISSLENTIKQGAKEAGGVELKILYKSLVRQAEDELGALEHYQTWHRQYCRNRG